MSAENQNPELSAENSQFPEPSCQIIVASENGESSTELELQETKECTNGLAEIRSDSAASNTSSEESLCSKCGGTKPNSHTDLDSLLKDSHFCKCDSQLNETQGEKRTNIANLESEAKVLETEGLISSMGELPTPGLDASNDSVARNTSDHSTSGRVSDNAIAPLSVEPKKLLNSGEKMSDAELEVAEDESDSPRPHTDAEVEDIVNMEEGNNGRLSPDATSVSSTRDLLPRNPPHIRCRADSYSSQTHREDCIDENLPLVLLACCLLCPLLVVVSLAIAYQLWIESKDGIQSSITGDFDRNSTADDE